MKRVVGIVFLLSLWAGLTIGPHVNSLAPFAPVLKAQPVPVVYPGMKVQWDQAAIDAADAALINHAITWDTGVKTDIAKSCSTFTSGQMICTGPVVPATTTAGAHTVTVTAYKVIDGTRYEASAAPYAFTYVIPGPPPVPMGCRFIR